MSEKDQAKSAGRRELIVKELLAALLLTLILLGLALLLPVGYATVNPLTAGAGEITAPWLIIWLQVLLRHLPPFLAGVLIPFVWLVMLAALPWLPGGGSPALEPRYHFGLHLALLLAIMGLMVALTFWGR